MICKITKLSLDTKERAISIFKKYKENYKTIYNIKSKGMKSIVYVFGENKDDVIKKAKVSPNKYKDLKLMTLTSYCEDRCTIYVNLEKCTDLELLNQTMISVYFLFGEDGESIFENEIRYYTKYWRYWSRAMIRKRNNKKGWIKSISS